MKINNKKDVNKAETFMAVNYSDKSFLLFIALFLFIFIPFSSAQGLMNPSSISKSSFFTGNLTNLSEMQDVNIPIITEGQFLRYLGATNKWIAYSFDLSDFWDFDYADLINKPTTLSQFTNNQGFYNVTTLPDLNASGIIIDWNSSGLIINWSNFNSGGNSSWNQSLADSLYYSITNPYGFYNSTTLPDLNASGIIKDWNSTGLIINWSTDLSSYYSITNPYLFWNETYAKFNKTYADSLYAPLGYGDSWNKTYADSLYYGLNNPYAYYNSTTLPSLPETDPHWTANQSSYSTTAAANALYKDIGIETWNSTSNGFNKTYADTLYYALNNPYGYYNSTTLPDLNASGILIDWNATGYIKDWSYLTGESYTHLSNFTNDLAFWNSTFALFNKTYADTLYQEIGSYLETESDPLWTANTTLYPKISELVGLVGNWTLDKASYSTTVQANGLYKAIGIETYNSTSNGFNETYADTLYAPINYGDNWNKTYADTLYHGLNNNENYWNSTFATFNKTYADTLYYGKYTNDLAFWNSTFALFNKTYADTLYLTAYTETDPHWTGNASLVYLNTNPYGFYNSTDFDIADYYTSDEVDGLIVDWNSSSLIIDWNTTGFIKDWNVEIGLANTSIKDYADATFLTSFTEEDPLWTANQSSYSTTASANALYKAIGITTWNGTHADFNKTYADTLYYNGVLNNLAFWNSTFATFNKTYADTLYYPISANTLGFWNSTSNGFNETYANTKYKPIGIETYNSTSNGFNETYANTKYRAFTNYSFSTIVNISKEVNMTSQNITTLSCITFATGGKICGV